MSNETSRDEMDLWPDEGYTNEARLVSAMQKMIKKEFPGSWVLKTVGGGFQTTGVPDLLVCYRGRMYAFEAKHRKPGESLRSLHRRVTLNQVRVISDMREAGASAHIVWTVAQVREILLGAGS